MATEMRIPKISKIDKNLLKALALVHKLVQTDRDTDEYEGKIARQLGAAQYAASNKVYSILKKEKVQFLYEDAAEEFSCGCHDADISLCCWSAIDDDEDSKFPQEISIYACVEGNLKGELLVAAQVGDKKKEWKCTALKPKTDLFDQALLWVKAEFTKQYKKLNK